VETYLEFLRSKIVLASETGFTLPPEEINPALKPHQRDAVLWALRGGRRALFESFGLGKTVQELEFCHQAVRHEGGKALIVLPLGVRQEFTRDAVELLHYAAPEYITSMAEADSAAGDVLMTNYERVRDGDIDPTRFTAVALDEASVLRSFGSKTYQTFLPKFQGVKYKLVSTATPSPNRYKELIHYAGYLEIMDTGQALTRFFQRDSTKANNLTLYPHKEDEFWLWVSSWALFIGKPSDLGYDDTGYALPPLDVRTHIVRGRYGEDADRDGQFKLMHDAAVSLAEASREKRESIDERVAVAKEIVDSDPEAHFILWHDLEAERHAICKALPDTVDIYGSMDYTQREKRVIDFSEGRCRLFATKKSLSGSGCNFQRHCHRAIFVGIDYEFNDFIQAVHRIYRFLQTEQVVIDIIYTAAEDPIYRVLMEKWKQHEYLQGKMREIVQKYGLSGSAQTERMARDYDKLDNWGRQAVRDLTDTELARMEDEARFMNGAMLEDEPKVINLYAEPAAAGIAVPTMGVDFEPYTLKPDDPQGAAFAVRLQGDSMEPYFPDGSIVFVNHDAMVNGDIGIFCVDSGTVCKQYYRDPLGMVYLFSLNRKRSDADVILGPSSNRTLICQGRVITKRRFPIPV
jgi:SOS-response transcriptional repressor LexA